jgi:thiol-disulfide isomerase/thioredoxin
MILIDVFSYSCMNCRRSLDHIRKLHARYQKEGLEVIIIHPPEWKFEKEYKNIKNIVDKIDLRFHVVLDKKRKIINRFNVNFWPAQILIHDSKVIHTQIGEGNYKKLEQVIRSRLHSKGKRVFSAEPTFTRYDTRYFGSRKGPFRNLKKEGKWKLSSECLSGRGTLSFSAKGRKIYLVAQAKKKTILQINGRAKVPVHTADLYTIFSSSKDRKRELRIAIPSSIQLYAVASE